MSPSVQKCNVITYFVIHMLMYQMQYQIVLV